MDIRDQFRSEYSERYRLAAEAHAEAKSDATRLEKLSKRVFSSLVTHSAGAISAREHAARCATKYTEIEDQWITAQTLENILEARKDAVKIEFEEWRSVNSSRRTEMKL